MASAEGYPRPPRVGPRRHHLFAEPEHLPQGVDPLLETTAACEPAISTGVYSYSTHGAVVAPTLQ